MPYKFRISNISQESGTYYVASIFTLLIKDVIIKYSGLEKNIRTF